MGCTPSASDTDTDFVKTGIWHPDRMRVSTPDNKPPVPDVRRATSHITKSYRATPLLWLARRSTSMSWGHIDAVAVRHFHSALGV